ncbi:hypothetical protein [Robbsia andropogonis]|uniref:hypothetical protein n=1 Tax=Robbsia andropogonis TaxID=28092 RepID=UPI000463F8D7|nr:hypothetical protein [Robbsia andropogonis]
MNKQKLSVLAVEHRAGISQKTGRPWAMHEAQCVLTQESADKGEQVLVGTINLPDHLKDTVPGDYLADFAFFRSMDGRLEPRVVSLAPLGGSRPVARPKADAVTA